MPSEKYGEEIKLVRLECIPENRLRAIEAEWAVHETSEPHEPMMCLHCMFGHYPVSPRSD